MVARKPLDGTVSANVLEYGTGALNIDGCRVAATPDLAAKNPHTASVSCGFGQEHGGAVYDPSRGRWPSNVVLTHAATPDGVDLCVDGCVPGCVVAELDEQAGVRTSGRLGPNHVDHGKSAGTLGAFAGRQIDREFGGDSGGASRFFPVFRFGAKAPARERPRVDGVSHPTIKPVALMRWLVRLVTPPGGVVLDPFLGSGTTAQAARAEGFQCVGIEREESYLPLIRERLDGGPGDLFGGVA